MVCGLKKIAEVKSLISQLPYFTLISLLIIFLQRSVLLSFCILNSVNITPLSLYIDFGCVSVISRWVKETHLSLKKKKRKRKKYWTSVFFVFLILFMVWIVFDKGSFLSSLLLCLLSTSVIVPVCRGGISKRRPRVSLSVWM